MKNFWKQTAAVLAASLVVSHLAFASWAAVITPGSWLKTESGYQFLDEESRNVTGWIRADEGWYYVDAATEIMSTGWKVIDGKQYYFTSPGEGTEGLMWTGWYKNTAGDWYFFNNKAGTVDEGTMIEGWNWIDGYCYYFEVSSDGKTGGRMYAGETTPDGSEVNSSGQWVDESGSPQYKAVSSSDYITAVQTAAETTESSSSDDSGSSSSGGSSSGGSSSSSSGSSSSGSTSSADEEEAAEETEKEETEAEETEEETEEEETEAEEETGEETEEEEDDEEEEETTEYAYYLMNIPYNDFYEAELSGNDADVAAVSSATLNKTRTHTSTMALGSYHVDPEGSDITGIIYPVRVDASADISALGGTEITDDSAVFITVTNRGTTSTTDLEGEEALFEAESYSYYELSEEPDFYKDAAISGSSVSFGASTAEASSVTDSVTATAETNYGDFQVNLSSTDVIGSPDYVSAVIVRTVNEDGEEQDYGLRHVENIWQQYKLAWSLGDTTTVHGSTVDYSHYESMEGNTITGLTYFTSDGIVEVELEESVEVELPEETFVLMNIPYDDFYEAELEGNDTEVAAVSSATLNKTRTHTSTMALGSYHVDQDGSDITGVIYPVKLTTTISDLLDLGGTQITDDSTVSITVTNRGTTSTTDLEGEEALFEAESYSFYVLAEEPEFYKEAEISGGSITFEASNADVTEASDTVEYTDDTNYGDFQVNLSSTDVIGSPDYVSAVIVRTVNEDGEEQDYGLRHVENIWQQYKLAWSLGDTTTVHGSTVDYSHYESMKGNTINSVTYFTSDGIVEVEFDEAVEVPDGSDEEVPVEYDSDEEALVATGDYTSEDVEAYIEAITSVSVDGTDYSASEVTIIKSDGSINTLASVTEDTEDDEDEETTYIFAESGDYDIIISADGYEDYEFSFTYEAEEEQEKETEVETEKETEKEAETEEETDAETEAEVGSETEAEAESELGTGAETGTGDETQTQTETETEETETVEEDDEETEDGTVTESADESETEETEEETEEVVSESNGESDEDDSEEDEESEEESDEEISEENGEASEGTLDETEEVNEEESVEEEDTASGEADDEPSEESSEEG